MFPAWMRSERTTVTYDGVKPRYAAMQVEVAMMVPGQVATKEALVWARYVADILTVSRFSLAIFILMWPWILSVPESLVTVVWLSLIGLTTDVLDGPFARYSQTPPSRVGGLDYAADVALAWSTMGALARMGYIWWWVLGLWTLAFLAVHCLYPVDAVRLGFLFLLLIPPPVLALVHSTALGLFYLTWVLAVLIMEWRKLHVQIDLFIVSLPRRWERWVRSWLPWWLTVEFRRREKVKKASSPR